MEGFFKLAGTFVTGLIVLAILLLVLGKKPEPCPPHICYPKSQIVSAEELIKKRQEAKKAGKELPMGQQ